MNELSSQNKEKIVNCLKEKGVKLKCPMCTNDTFTLIDGYFNELIQPAIKGGLVIGGPSIPSIGIACNQCGFISKHALGALGLLENENKNGE